MGFNDLGLRKRLGAYKNARILHLWTAYRRFNGRFTVATEHADFAARVNRGLRPSARLQFLVQHVHRSLRRSVGAFDCIDESVDREFSTLLQDATTSRLKQPRLHRAASKLVFEGKTTESLLLREAVRALNTSGSASRVLVVSGGRRSREERRDLKMHAERELNNRVLWLDDLVPSWYATDFDTPEERDTHARSVVESRVCARARRFIGNFAAPSTHAICHLRNAAARGKHGGNGASSGRVACEDAWRRVLPTKYAWI